jgi:hypothetical protein
MNFLAIYAGRRYLLVQVMNFLADSNWNYNANYGVVGIEKRLNPSPC